MSHLTTMADRGPGRRKAKEGPQPTERAGREVKTVEVPYPTSNSGVPLTAPVSVAKAPWDEEEGQ